MPKCKNFGGPVFEPTYLLTRFDGEKPAQLQTIGRHRFHARRRLVRNQAGELRASAKRATR